MNYCDIHEISFNNRNVGGLFSLVLDGTVCCIHRPPRWMQQLFYTGKNKIHRIKYEIGVHPETGFLVWVGGPVYASMHDFRLMQLAGIFQGLLPGELILADKGYIGAWHIVTPFRTPLPGLESLISTLLSAQRWIVEHVLARFKFFKILGGVWRHSLDIHGYVFYVIAEIVNIDMHFAPVCA